MGIGERFLLLLSRNPSNRDYVQNGSETTPETALNLLNRVFSDFAILVAGKFFGLMGMLLAVPATGVIKVTSRELYQGIRRFKLI